MKATLSLEALQDIIEKAKTAAEQNAERFKLYCELLAGAWAHYHPGIDPREICVIQDPKTGAIYIRKTSEVLNVNDEGINAQDARRDPGHS